MTVYQEEETEAAMELAASLADSLMDHFTEKGLMAKEIKVAEIVEMGNDAEEWDTSEETNYTFYGDKLLTVRLIAKNNIFISI